MACQHPRASFSEAGCAYLARGALPEHDSEGVDVSLLGVALVRQHLGRHPLEGAQTASQRVQVMHHSRQPKVRHAHTQRVVHKQIACPSIFTPLSLIPVHV